MCIGNEIQQDDGDKGMSEGLNLVVLTGHLGGDPELKSLQGGQSVLNLRLATTETYLDKNNARQERTDWHNLTVWGKRGESLAKILRKGSQITVTGGLRTTSYEKDGEKRYRTNVDVRQVILCGTGGGKTETEVSDEEIPF